MSLDPNVIRQCDASGRGFRDRPAGRDLRQKVRTSENMTIVAVLFAAGAFGELYVNFSASLARISQTIERIGGANQRELLCGNNFHRFRETPDADRVYAESV
jgi:hypothetical protein